MNRKIKSYQDLVHEEERLSILLHDREWALRNYRNRLEKEIEPVFKAIEWLQRIISLDASNPVLISGIRKIVMDGLRKVFLTGTKGWLRLVAPWMLRFVSGKVLNGLIYSLLSKMGSWMGKNSSAEEDGFSDEPAGQNSRRSC